MRVHLIKKQTIEDFLIVHAQGRSSFENWLTAVKYTDWAIPEDIKKTFRSADLLGSGSNRVVFDIGGNNYRMICKYHFGNLKVHLFVCWLGIHAEYDQLCDTKMQYLVNTN
jgi:mRNA interferase HigB